MNKNNFKTKGISIKDNFANRGNDSDNITSSGTLQLKKPVDVNQTQVKYLPKMSEMKGEKIMNDLTTVLPESQSLNSEAEDKAFNIDDNVNEIPTCDNQTAIESVTKSRKKRRRRRPKSTRDASRIDSLKSAELESSELDTSDSIREKIASYKDLIAARISAIEAATLKSKVEIHDNVLSSDGDIDLHLKFDKKDKKYLIADVKNRSATEKSKEKVTFNIMAEDDEGSPKYSQVCFYAEKSQPEFSTRPVIFMADKTTQTDTFVELPVNSKAVVENSIEFCWISDSSITSEATESSYIFSSEETSIEFFPEYSDISDRIDSSMNLASQEDNLQSITEDFIKNMKISKENFKAEFTKCFEDVKKC